MRTISSLLVTEGATHVLLLQRSVTLHSREDGSDANVLFESIYLYLHIKSLEAQDHPIPEQRLVRKFAAEDCDQSMRVQ